MRCSNAWRMRCPAPLRRRTDARPATGNLGSLGPKPQHDRQDRDGDCHRYPRPGAVLSASSSRRQSKTCPVEALNAWLAAAAITTGPLFRRVHKGGKVGTRLNDQSVADIVKVHANRVGLDPKLFSGHSLRSGFLTSAAAKGASIFKMMDVSRHRSVDTLRGYVRDAEIFKDHAGAGLL
jgi:integrase